MVKITGQSRIGSWCRLNRYDLLIGLGLGVVFSLALFWASASIDPKIFDQETMNIWFEGDMPRIFDNVTDRWGSHYRVRVHPLFSLVAYPPVYLVSAVGGLDTIPVLRGVMALVAYFWIMALFTLLRRLGLPRFDAALFSLLGAVSAASVFWFTAPDTYAFGSLTLIGALLLILPGKEQGGHFMRHMMGGVLTLSMTITNWMLSIIASFLLLSWKRALLVCACALMLVACLWCLQKQVFPHTDFFGLCFKEARYATASESMDPAGVAGAFLFHTMVMPEIRVVPKFGRPDWPVMTVQSSRPGSSGALGMVATVLWVSLLGLGLWALVKVKRLGRFRWVLILSLLGQFGLHLVYGDETFLYALHFAPLLVVFASLGSLTRARWISLVLAAMLVVTAGLNNSLQFKEATGYFQRYAPGLERVEPEKVFEDD